MAKCHVLINLPANAQGIAATAACGNAATVTVTPIPVFGAQPDLLVCANHAAIMISNGDVTNPHVGHTAGPIT